MALTLAANITAAASTLRVSGGDVVAVGFRFRLDDEMIDVSGFEPYPIQAGKRSQSGLDTSRWIVNRGLGGSVAASHNAGASIVAATDAYVSGANLTRPVIFPAAAVDELTADELAAIQGATGPSAANVFTTRTGLAPALAAGASNTLEIVGPTPAQQTPPFLVLSTDGEAKIEGGAGNADAVGGPAMLWGGLGNGGATSGAQVTANGGDASAGHGVLGFLTNNSAGTGGQAPVSDGNSGVVWGGIKTGAGAPSGAPDGFLPIYFRTSDSTLYVWDGSAWQGPWTIV